MTREGYGILAILFAVVGAMISTDGTAEPWLRKAGLFSFLILSGGFVYGLIVPEPVRLILGRGALVVFPVFVLGVLAVIAIIQMTGLDWRLRQALVAATVVVAGWLVTFFFQESRAAEERQERTKDILLALRAEILDCYNTYTYRDRQTVQFGEEVVDRIVAGGDEARTVFHPFVARDAKPLIFRAVESDIRVLPGDVIDNVIQFYCQLADVNAFAESIMSSEFRAMTADRRASAYRHYINMTIEAEFRAVDALIALNKALGLEAADFESKRAARAAQMDYRDPE